MLWGVGWPRSLCNGLVSVHPILALKVSSQKLLPLHLRHYLARDSGLRPTSRWDSRLGMLRRALRKLLPMVAARLPWHLLVFARVFSAHKIPHAELRRWSRTSLWLLWL